MTLPEFSVRRIVLVSMAFMVVVLFGLVSWKMLPRDLFPEIEPPAISVMTSYPGASAEDVENKVTRIIENNLSIVSNLKKLTSTSSEGASFVTCEFEWGVNLDEASNDIRDRLEFATKLLPDDAEKPMLFKFNTAMFPVAVYGATATESYPQLNRTIDKEVGDRLKRVEGVGAVQVFGGRVRQINVILDRPKLQAAALTPAQVAGRIAAENYTLPAGSIKVASREYQLRVPGEFTDVHEIAATVLKAQGSQVLRLADVAEVVDGHEEETRTVEVDGQPGVIFIIQKRSGANTVNVLKRVQARLEELKPGLPRDVRVQEVFNSAKFIERSLSDLSEATLVGAALVVLVTLFMLRRVRASLVVLTAIPTSLIAAFGGLYLMGYTLNVITLFSIAIVVGMVVDDAIVVVDNVSRHIERGERPWEAAVFGTSEVASAVIASTLTTIVVFVPLFFVKGITRIFFTQLAMVLIISLGCSLLVALTLSPALCSRIMKREREMRKLSARGFFALGEKTLNLLETAYARLLAAALRRRWAVALVALGVLALTVPPLALIGKEFTPEQDTGDISISVELAVGTRVERTTEIARSVRQILTEECGPDMVHSYISSGQDRKAQGGRFGAAEGAHIFAAGAKLVSKDRRKRGVKEIADAVRQRLERRPQIVKLDISTQNPMDRMLLGGGKPIQVEIIGHDLAATDRLAAEVAAAMRRVPGARDVSVSRETGKPEIDIRVNRELASQKGVSTRALAETLRDSVYGSTASQYRVGGDDWDIFLQFSERDRRTIEDVRQLPVPTLTGGFVPLAAVAEVRETSGPITIQRQDQERLVTVGCSSYGRDMGSTAEEIEREVGKLVLPPETTVAIGGMYKEFRDIFADFILLGLLAVALVYMVMAAQYESLLDPLIIMFAVPFAATGVVWGLWLMGMTINLVSLIGILLLVGIVVKNAIVLVDYTNLLRARGLGIFEAVQQAGRNRLRPVLMTTVTTIFGLLPLAFARGEGSETWQPLGVTVLSGLTISTLITLVLVPTLYSWTEELREKWRRRHPEAVG